MEDESGMLTERRQHPTISFLPKVSVLVFIGVVYFAQPSLQGRALKGSVGLSMVNHFNQTGHCTFDFELSQVFQGSKRSWRANIKHDVYEHGGLEEHVVKGLLTAPPPKPSDYELFPGIGFYKFHPERRNFSDSLKVCTDEGGHLAIINSIPEANVLKTLYARHSDAWRWAHIGFHDPRESGTRGNYETIFGESLKSAGYD
ncbi:hemolymph lipopolysaccharide-binding protein-like [Ischnura elegans]|uniref:hemolymph lipopolysaccharide-binding protein-like n=1 Tax=Ischnura elegans TaxID=197161 RepID=UPI001ED8965D|nr:hemolymph lipopolysaccharide-binding protein-like [Ischnura elegans]